MRHRGALDSEQNLSKVMDSVIRAGGLIMPNAGMNSKYSNSNFCVTFNT